jgi:hypothetical protein
LLVPKLLHSLNQICPQEAMNDACKEHQGTFSKSLPLSYLQSSQGASSCLAFAAASTATPPGDLKRSPWVGKAHKGNWPNSKCNVTWLKISVGLLWLADRSFKLHVTSGFCVQHPPYSIILPSKQPLTHQETHHLLCGL